MRAAADYWRLKEFVIVRAGSFFACTSPGCVTNRAMPAAEKAGQQNPVLITEDDDLTCGGSCEDFWP